MAIEMPMVSGGSGPALELIAAAVVGLWLAACVLVLVRGWGVRGIAPRRRGPPGLFGQIVERAPFPIWWRDAGLKLVGGNAVARTACAGSEHPSREFEPSLETARAVSASGRPSRREEHVVIAGERRLMDVTRVPLEGGGVAGFAIDMTDRAEARAALARGARALTATLDRLSAGVALFAADETLAFCNAPFTALFGLDPLWLDGHPHFEQVLSAMRAADRLPEQHDFAGWCAERRRWFTRAEGPIEEQWTLRTGEILRVAVEQRPEGGLLVIFEDQTEQMRLASMHDTLLHVHQTMLDHLTEGVAVFAPDGRLRLFNRRFAEIVLVPPEVLVAKPHAESLIAHVALLLNEPERAKGLRELIASATAGRVARSGRISSNLGRTLDYAAVPLPDGNALLTFTDVTGSVGASPAATAA